MSFFKDLFLKIAKKFNLELQEKKEGRTNDYKKIDNISMTSIMANQISNITLMDSDVEIVGNTERAKALQKQVEDFIHIKMPIASEISLGTGDCLIKPYTDGKRIGVDIIENDRFIIHESIGDFIKACTILAEEIKDSKGNLFQRMETQILRKGSTIDGNTVSVVMIYQTAFKNGKEIQMSDIASWAEIPTEIMIPNSEKLLFGRYKCPTINRDNVNSVNGVPITYGMDRVMKNAVEAYERFNREFEKKEAWIFADKTMFKKDADNNSILVKGIERVVMPVNLEDETIKIYSPQIYADEYEKAIDVNFRILEMCAGFSTGILTKSTTNYATATEIKANLHATYAFITKFRFVLTKGTKDLLYAINLLMNANNMTPLGDWEISFNWSEDLMLNLAEKFSQLIQGEAIGANSVAEVRAWLMNEDLETAKKEVEMIAQDFTKEM